MKQFLIRSFSKANDRPLSILNCFRRSFNYVHRVSLVIIKLLKILVIDYSNNFFVGRRCWNTVIFKSYDLSPPLRSFACININKVQNTDDVLRTKENVTSVIIFRYFFFFKVVSMLYHISLVLTRIVIGYDKKKTCL